MAYCYYDTGVMILMNQIQELADKLKVCVEFETGVGYDELTAFHANLQAEYMEKLAKKGICQ